MSNILTYQTPYEAININNIYGKYWAFIYTGIYGLREPKIRLGTFSSPYQEYCKDYSKFIPFPTLVTENYSHDELCNQRAIELFNISKFTGKRIALMWSGGIDSTTVLTSFIKNLSKDDLENISIILNLTSILENKQYYKKYIQGKFHIIPSFDFEISNNFFEQYILIHGDPGDGVYGPSTTMYWNLIESGEFSNSWQDNQQLMIRMLDEFIKRGKGKCLLIPEGFGQWYINKVSDNIREVNPAGIDSISDWWWWHYLNMKWEDVLWHHFNEHKKNLRDEIATKHIEDYLTNTFYNTSKFQSWSYSNLKNHISTDIRKHKLPAKKYIFELDHNQEYFENKRKTPSLSINIAASYPRSIRYSLSYVDKNWAWHTKFDPGVEEFMLDRLENYTG